MAETKSNKKKGWRKEEHTKKLDFITFDFCGGGVATPFGNAQPLSLESWPTLYRMSGAALFSQYRPTSLPRSTYFFTESCTSSTDCPSAGGKKKGKRVGEKRLLIAKKERKIRKEKH